MEKDPSKKKFLSVVKKSSKKFLSKILDFLYKNDVTMCKLFLHIQNIWVWNLDLEKYSKNSKIIRKSCVFCYFLVWRTKLKCFVCVKIVCTWLHHFLYEKSRIFDKKFFDENLTIDKKIFFGRIFFQTFFVFLHCVLN